MQGRCGIFLLFISPISCDKAIEGIMKSTIFPCPDEQCIIKHAAKDLSARDLLLAPCYGQVSSNFDTRVFIEDQDQAEKSCGMMMHDRLGWRGDPCLKVKTA